MKKVRFCVPAVVAVHGNCRIPWYGIWAILGSLWLWILYERVYTWLKRGRETGKRKAELSREVAE